MGRYLGEMTEAATRFEVTISDIESSFGRTKLVRLGSLKEIKV